MEIVEKKISGIYFNKVWNCVEYSVNSETNNVFEEHLTQIFISYSCILMNMNVAFILWHLFQLSLEMSRV